MHGPTCIFWANLTSFSLQIAEEKHLPPLNGLPIIGSFLSFFLVFYAGQAYTRFNSQYFTSMSCEGRIFDICSMAYSSLDRSAAIRLWRHINLAHALAYVGLSPAYTVKNFLEPLNEEFALCSEKEYAKLLKLDPDGGGGATREVITWATNDIISQVRKARGCFQYIHYPTLNSTDTKDIRVLRPQC